MLPECTYQDALCPSGLADEVFLVPKIHVKQNKDVGSTPTLPSHRSCHGRRCVRPCVRPLVAVVWLR